MAFITKRKIKGKYYYALVESHRDKNKVRQKFIAHIGSKKPTEMEVGCIINSYKGKDFILKDYRNNVLPYSEVSKLNNLIGDYRKNEKRLLATELGQRKESFLVGFVHNTNSIEGNSLTEEEVYLLTHDGIAPKEKTLKEIHETENMKEAYDFISAYKGHVSTNLTKDLHRLVQKNIETETLGKVKIKQNYVTGSDHLPTPPIFTNKRMKQLISWKNKNEGILHPVELASLFHLQFLIIHPFMDGNGRIGRLLHNLILMQSKLPPMIFYNNEKQNYYETIKNGLQGTPIPFLKFCYKMYLKNLRYWER